jgi:hypothetical protein
VQAAGEQVADQERARRLADAALGGEHGDGVAARDHRRRDQAGVQLGLLALGPGGQRAPEPHPRAVDDAAAQLAPVDDRATVDVAPPQPRLEQVDVRPLLQQLGSRLPIHRLGDSPGGPG